MTSIQSRDKSYLDILIRPIRVCGSYQPKMGRGDKQGQSLEQFQRIYRNDSFYSWFGLDHPLMYAAHKAAGGMTSIYRQIGIGSETLIRTIIQDELGISEDQSKWSYKMKDTNKKEHRLSLDARIQLGDVETEEKRVRIRNWIRNACEDLDIDHGISSRLQGIVFEIRQGYKSKDSKRQNADIANAATAYTQAYLPCILVMSNQIDPDVLHRYRLEKWVVLTGCPDDTSPLASTYAFMREVVGYDLSSFFIRTHMMLRTEVTKVLESLLRVE